MITLKYSILFIVLVLHILQAKGCDKGPEEFVENIENDENQNVICSRNVGQSYSANDNVSYTIQNKFYRKKQYFTQGLSFLSSDILLESSGMYGASYLHAINYKTSEIIKQVKLDKSYFGEGSDMIKIQGKEYFYYLTWKQRKAFVYDTNLKQINSYDLPKEVKEGWGLTHFEDENGKTVFLLTDGTNQLFHIDPQTFKIIKILPIYFNGKQLRLLNEIEIYKGTLLANTFLTPYIYQIDYNTGNVIQQLNFNEIIKDLDTSEGYERFTQKDRNNCLNGIAYDDQNDNLILSGKMWPWFYQIKLNDL